MAEEIQEAKTAKKEKAPGVETKPFSDFIQDDFLPALKVALTKYGIDDLALKLVNQKVAVTGMSQVGSCWQVVGSWMGGKRQFNVYFPKEDIQSDRAFSCCSNAVQASVLEPFLIDERKITLELMVFGVIQRLNGQKWLSLN